MLRLLVLLLGILVEFAFPDSIIRNGYEIQLRIDTSHSNVFELGQNEVYTRLPFGDEKIQITCSKINCLEDGTMYATVNSNVATSRTCLSHAGNWSSEYKCLAQTFDYALYRNDMGGFYDVVCQMRESRETAVSYRIIKLFVDSHPRLRTGLKLHHQSSILFYQLNSTPALSCEAVQDTGPAKNADQLVGRRFDRIEWFVYETNENLNITSTNVLHLTNSVLNFSSVFLPAQHVASSLSRNIPYKCCTMQGSEQINCQAVFYVH